MFLHSEQGLRAGSKVRYGWYLVVLDPGTSTWTATHSMIGVIGTFASQALAEAACTAVDADKSRHPGTLRRSAIGL
ncbi:MAG: hypothetical protein H0W83_14955 [Planctomycetes bacterium]|nr:hypothetical protein [Planctomycetota bacterium]